MQNLLPHPSLAEVAAYATDARTVSIARTAEGTPHIRAGDFESLGYGQGHVAADDHATVLYEHLTTLLGERSLYHGPDERPGDGANLDSDIGYRALDYRGQAQTALAQMSLHANALVDGYVAGFNHRVTALVEAGVPVAPWLGAPPRPITRLDIAAVLLALADEASGRRFVQAIALAQPPDARTADGTKPASDQARPSSVAGTPNLPGYADLPIGSNAWAVGGDATASSESLLLANPHFGFADGLRLYQVHLTIPGAFDVAGVSILGCPTVNLGFNAAIAWTHTVSAADRFLFHRLRLVPGDATAYLWQDAPEAMQQRQIAIPVRGEAHAYIRHVWSSRHGLALHVPGAAEWTAESVLCLSNANAGNPEVLDHWLAIGAARSLDDIARSFTRWAGTSWVNIVAIDAHGEACYIDGSNIPEVGDETRAALSNRAHPLAQARKQNGFAVLPGDLSSHTAAHRRPRAISERPHRRTRAVIANFNNPYQRVDCDRPLPEHHPLFGAFDAPLSPRARRGYRQTALLQRPIRPAALARLTLDNHVQMADMLLDDLLALGARAPSIITARSGVRIDLTHALAVLRDWDRKDALDASGSPLFREFVQAYLEEGQGYARGFDPTAPFDTPTGLPIWTEADPAPALVALATAVERLARHGFEPAVTLRTLQYREQSDGGRMPLDGGPNLTGVLNVSQVGAMTPRERLAQLQRGRVPLPSGLGPHGYGVNFGTTWLATMTFEAGKPVVHSVLPQSQRSRPGTSWSDGHVVPHLGSAASRFPFDVTEVSARTVTHVDLTVPH